MSVVFSSFLQAFSSFFQIFTVNQTFFILHAFFNVLGVIGTLYIICLLMLLFKHMLFMHVSGNMMLLYSLFYHSKS